MTDPTPIITLHQPWAGAVMLGWKSIETRFHDKFRVIEGRRIGIHASRKWDLDAWGAMSPWLTEEQRTLLAQATGRHFEHLTHERYYQSRPFRVSALLGHVWVRRVDWLTSGDSPAALIDCGIARRFGLFLADPWMLPAPHAMTGKQGIWYRETRPMASGAETAAG